MTQPTQPVLARDIHYQAETAILTLLTDAKAEAYFLGEGYTAIRLKELQDISNYYRRLAIQRGEILPGPNEGPVNVSYARITGEPWGYI